MNIIINKFTDLDIFTLYSILQLRNEIFIVEQDCPYPDIDNHDQQSWHIYGEINGEVVAVLRIIPGEIPAIGRVAVKKIHRGKGYAKKLMEKAIRFITRELKTNTIKLQAQHYLLNFYQSLGFRSVSNIYLEDNIPHVDMLYSVNINE